MTAILLHLSDIHIERESDFILERAEKIAATTFTRLPAATAVFIVVSGDIAQAGLPTEFELAKILLRRIQQTIKAEKDIPIEFLIVPGNHDCNFSGDLTVRSAVLKDIPNHELDMPEALIAEATKVQDAFRTFRHGMLNHDSIIHEDLLWSVQNFSVEGKTLWFDTINASWMSSKHEQQGGILFPFAPYRDFKPSDADLRIGVLHHPLNWFQQGNYQEFRTFLQALEDLIFTGHEHDGNASLRAEAKSGECAILEGCALQHKFSGVSELNIVTLDVEAQQFACEKFTYVDDLYRGTGEENWFPMRALPKRSGLDFQLTDSFARILKDPGATLRHPDKSNLNLDDFYVYPDLDRPTDNRGNRPKIAAMANKKNSQTLTLLASLETDVLLEGDENVGKTRLLHQLYSSYHSQGFLPLYVDARRVKSSTDAEISKLLRKTITEQYGERNLTAFEQTPSAKKILLIDDFDSCPLEKEGRQRFHDHVVTAFQWRVITVGEAFEFSELVSASKLSTLASYSHYKILPLGYERRGELVKKWNTIGRTEVTSTNQWLQACYQAEKLIEAAKLQHVATTVPIMVLSLLQANSSGVTKEMHNSSFAHYFYFLIVGAFGNAGVSANDLNRYLAFCSHLSWFVKSNGADLEISESQFRAFCDEYSKSWTKTTADEAISVLVQARILNQHNDLLCFAYQYTYYYFLGRYTSQFIEHTDVKAYLDYCMENLYVRECANTLLFLAHHSGNSYVVDRVVAALDARFPGRVPVSFSADDVRTVSSLISGAPLLAYRAIDPVENRKKLHRIQDKMDTGHDGLADSPSPPDSSAGLIDEIVSLSKTIEIAGALLSNHYASLSRDKKNASLEKIFNSCLRVISDFFAFVEANPDRLIQEVASRFRSKKRDLVSSEAEVQARHAIAWMIRLVSASWIIKAGRHVNSADLEDNVSDVTIEASSVAFQLIQLSQVLDTPARLPRAAIKKIIQKEKDNPCVMSVLHMLVLGRLYMYETHHEDKHWAISTFDLTGQKNKLNAAEHNRRFDDHQRLNRP